MGDARTAVVHVATLNLRRVSAYGPKAVGRMVRVRVAKNGERREPRTSVIAVCGRTEGSGCRTQELKNQVHLHTIERRSLTTEHSPRASRFTASSIPPLSLVAGHV